MPKKKFTCDYCGNRVKWIQRQKSTLDRALGLLMMAQKVLSDILKDESMVQEVIIEFTYTDDLEEAIESVKATR